MSEFKQIGNSNCRNSLVSIIIPTYNRASLLGETLDSIKLQTYKKWECIVVDDGSTDFTMELMEFYCERDERIKFFSRPGTRMKGANACRNFGLSVSNGEYINWFDSDDIMHPNNLELKVKMLSADFDFIIGNSVNFHQNGTFSRPYPLNYARTINAENFIRGRIGWITNDVLIRKIALSVTFDERLQSHQEYNFFCKFLSGGPIGKYLERDVAMRRIHSYSIQEGLKEKPFIQLRRELFYNEYILYQDIRKLIPMRLKDRSIKRLIRFSFELSHKQQINLHQVKVLFLLLKECRLNQWIYYSLWMLSNLILGRGYFFIKLSKR